MNRYTFERAIKARLKHQGCVYLEAASTSISMAFRIEHSNISFFIPRPTQDKGWTLAQLNKIEQLLAALDLDFLPLDYLH